MLRFPRFGRLTPDRLPRYTVSQSSHPYILNNPGGAVSPTSPLPNLPTGEKTALSWQNLIILGVAALCLPNSAAAQLGAAVRSAVTKVSPSVVRIQIIGSPDRSGKIGSRITTGVVVSAHGEIISSSFGFLSEIAAIFVTTADGKRHSAEIVATDHVRKLTLLRTSTRQLSPPAWARKRPSVGAWAVAVGRFYNSSKPSASLGVISAVNRVHGLAIQTDAKVSPINYGGPLLIMDGQVSGILVPLAPGNKSTGVAAGVQWYDSGIGFAIPASDVLDSVQRLRSGEDRKHGVLGISLTTANPLSAKIEVKSIHPGSPADVGGMEVGDKILSVNGRKLQRAGTFQSILRSRWAGDTAFFIVRRGSEEKHIEVALTDEITVPERGWLGILPVATAASDDERGQGIMVGIPGSSAASAAGLPARCILRQVDGMAIDRLNRFREVLTEVTAGTTHQLTFSLPDRPTDLRTVSVVADSWKKQDIPRLALEVADVQTNAPTNTSVPVWTQSVVSLNEGTHAWVLGPQEHPLGMELGVIIMLHDGAPATETLMQEWRSVCQQHQLVLAVVYHDDAIPLDPFHTLENIMTVVMNFGTIDPDRITLVTRESHAEFVSQVFLDPQIPHLRQAVFVGCRPLIVGVSLENVYEKNSSLLFFPGGDNKQSQALSTAAVAALQNAGATVVVSPLSVDVRGAELAGEIARWMLLQKIR
ncbi:MAG: PDZ domain-containing protein [Fuerstiella sp.]|nr:PDZ domain-containing protein [Fuerstiella sp.]